MWDSLKQYLHGFQIQLEGRVCAVVGQTLDAHQLSCAGPKVQRIELKLAFFLCALSFLTFAGVLV